MDNKRQRFIELSWQILEHKARYYLFDSPSIEDYAYDLLEKEYDALAKELGEPMSASDMVGFDLRRPSCQKVLERQDMKALEVAKGRKK